MRPFKAGGLKRSINRSIGIQSSYSRTGDAVYSIADFLEIASDDDFTIGLNEQIRINPNGRSAERRPGHRNRSECRIESSVRIEPGNALPGRSVEGRKHTAQQ